MPAQRPGLTPDIAIKNIDRTVAGNSPSVISAKATELRASLLAQRRWGSDGAGQGADAGDSAKPKVDEHNHDTIAMVAVDERGSVAAGASSNGANHKVLHRL